MKSPEYKQYEGKSKEERRITVAQGESLEVKRFSLSANPEVKARLRKLQDIVYKLKEEYPGIISLSLYGSLTKGYATKESDVDAFLHVASEVYKDDEDYLNEMTKHFEEKVRRNLALDKKQAGDILFDVLDKKEIEEACKHGFVDARTPIFRLFLLSIGRDINEYR